MADGRDVQSQVPRSVISAKVKLADLCKSMLSEYTRVDNARRGSPEKKSVSARWQRSVCRRAAQRRREQVHFQGSLGDRRQLHARCRPALGRRCCPWSVLCATRLVTLRDGRREVGDAYRRSTRRTAWIRSPWCRAAQGSEGPGGLPAGCRGGDDGRRRESQARQTGDAQLRGRTATCDGLSRWVWC